MKLLFLSVVAAMLLAPAAALAQYVPCTESLVHQHELIGSAPGGEAWAVRRLYTTTAPEKEDGASCGSKAVYPKVKNRENWGTSLLLCRAGQEKCQELPIYEDVECEAEAKAKTSEAQAAQNLAAAKKAFADAKVDLGKPGRRLDAKGGPLDAGLLAGMGIKGGATVKLSERSLTVAAPSLGTVVLATGETGDEADRPAAWLSADGALVVWAAQDDLCGGERRLEAGPLKSIAASLLYRRGAGKYHSKDVAGAAEDFNAAWTLDPANAQYGLALGYAKLLAGKKDEAKAALDKVLQSKPEAGL